VLTAILEDGPAPQIIRVPKLEISIQTATQKKPYMYLKESIESKLLVHIYTRNLILFDHNNNIYGATYKFSYTAGD
jgi:hypothetical protein